MLKLGTRARGHFVTLIENRSVLKEAMSRKLMKFHDTQTLKK